MIDTIGMGNSRTTAAVDFTSDDSSAMTIICNNLIILQDEQTHSNGKIGHDLRPFEQNQGRKEHKPWSK